MKAVTVPADTRVRVTKDTMPLEIKLKVGARIVVTRNLDISRGLVNGALGAVMAIQDAVVRVRIDGKEEDDFIQRSKQRAEAVDGGGEVWIYQFPLALAWGVTVHRVQGMTLERAHFNLTDRFFAAGQAYVALSRVRRREDLHLLAFSTSAIKIDQEVLRRFGGLPVGGEEWQLPPQTTAPLPTIISAV